MKSKNISFIDITVQLSHDLKKALERLNQNPTNSSRPSGSLAPWDKGNSDPDENDSSSEKRKAGKQRSS